MINIKVDGEQGTCELTISKNQDLAGVLSEVVMIITSVADKISDSPDDKIQCYNAVAACITNPLMQLTMLGAIEKREEL